MKATIRATWALITPEECHRLMDSMPRRIAAVNQAKGALSLEVLSAVHVHTFQLANISKILFFLMVIIRSEQLQDFGVVETECPF